MSRENASAMPRSVVCRSHAKFAWARSPGGSVETSARARRARHLLRTRQRSCNCCKVSDRDRNARELRSVAPLLVDGALIGPVTLVRNGDRTIGVTDAELLRPHVGAALTVATMLDGSATAAV